MAKFALLLNHAADRYEGLSQDEYMDIIKDYVAWVESMVESGTYQGGHKLVADGRLLERTGGGIDVREMVASEVTEILGGVMIIEAVDYDEAVELARGHPHLKHNSRMEIRQLDEQV